ncbi:MAG: tetratricopeptide repeat protein [Candidatus Omnitrophota bacterium]
MNKRRDILFIILIILIVFISSLANDFAWDDYDLVVSNPFIKSFSWLKEIFTNQLYKGNEKESNFYRPLQLCSYILDYSLWQLNPFGYHLTNLILHMLNSVILYLLLMGIGLSPQIALFTCLIFGIAPMISGITFYISARADLLAVFFGFLSMLCFIKFTKVNRKIFYFLSLLFFVSSLFSKEMALTVPFLLMLIVSYSDREKCYARLRMTLPYFLLILLYAAIRTRVFYLRGDDILQQASTAFVPFYARMITDIEVVARYLRLFFIPFPLHMDWHINPSYSILNIKIFASVVFLAAFFMACRKLYDNNRMVLFGLSWFFIAIVPVLNIYPISVFFGEGWLYLPSVGIFIIVSIFFIEIIGRRYGKIARNVLFILFLAYYSVFTMSYSMVWKDSSSLFNNVLKYEKNSPYLFLTWNNLAMSYYTKKDYESALECCKKSISLNPRYKKAYNKMGIAYTALKKYASAIMCFKKALKLDINYAQAYNNLSRAYVDIGLNEKALATIKKLLAIDPDYYPAYYTLGFIYGKKGDTENAVKAFKEVKALRPYRYEPYLCLGNIYREQGRFKDALQEYEKVMPLITVGYEFYNDLAFLYIKNKRFSDGENVLRQSLKLNRQQGEVYNNLGNIYSYFNKPVMAVESYCMAISIEPANLNFRHNLVCAYQEFYKKTMDDEYLRCQKREWKNILKTDPCFRKRADDADSERTGL